MSESISNKLIIEALIRGLGLTIKLLKKVLKGEKI